VKEETNGKIFLMPSALGEEGIHSIPEYGRQLMQEIDYFLVENERSARRFLRAIGYKKNFDEVRMISIEQEKEFTGGAELMKFLHSGRNAAVISEAGSPGIADPGAVIVSWAHHHNVAVVPLVGPSSIFMALMASGMNGQQFAFHGYLPISSSERKRKLKQLEEDSAKNQQTQIFIETPYRNDAILKDMLDVLHGSTLLCIAANITLPSEKILTQSVKEWKFKIPLLKKQPAIFLLLAKPSRA
jgi:16S rRNA (cytidine1402-2'-O)-methyltransferase